MPPTHWFASLFGITNLQVVIYYKKYPNDWWFYRYSVRSYSLPIWITLKFMIQVAFLWFVSPCLSVVMIGYQVLWQGPRCSSRRFDLACPLFLSDWYVRRSGGLPRKQRFVCFYTVLQCRSYSSSGLTTQEHEGSSLSPSDEAVLTTYSVAVGCKCGLSVFALFYLNDVPRRWWLPCTSRGTSFAPTFWGTKVL